MKESTTYQAILREGREEGLQQGREEGTVAEAKRILVLVGEDRFGPLDARIKAALESITDLRRLEELCLLAQHVDGWHALLGLSEPRRRNGRRRSNPY